MGTSYDLVLRELCTFAGMVLPVIHRLTAFGVLPIIHRLTADSSQDMPLAYTAKTFVTRAVSLEVLENGQQFNRIHTRMTVACSRLMLWELGN